MVDVVGVGFAGIAAIGLAGQALFVRIGTTSGKSNDALLITFLINIIVIIPITLALFYPDFGVTPLAILAFIGAGALGTMVGRALLFAGIQRIGASRAEPIKASMPLHATIIAVLVLGEVLTISHLFGIIFIVSGIALISWEGSRSAATLTDAPMLGLALPFMAAFFFGLEPIFAKIGFGEGTPFLVGLSIKLTVATFFFGTYLFSRNQLPTRRDLQTSNLRWYLAAGIASTVFSLAYYAALIRAPVVIVIPIMQSSPLFVAAVSILFLQRLERVTPRLMAGVVVVVAGAILVTLAS